MTDENTLSIYTDGSSLPNPRRGGIGVRFVYVNSDGNEEVEDFSYPGYKGGTNNEMELLAVITGLEEATTHAVNDNYDKIIVRTDSQYVCDNVDNAKYAWPKSKWLRINGQPVLNVKLWKRLIKIFKDTNKRIKIEWVKGHSKDKHNKAVDKLAKKSANIALNEGLTVKSVRKKQTKEKTKVGSVGIEGQRISIRIIEYQYLNEQKLYRYRYEVISKGSPYYKKVDWITSNKHIRDGHKYYVHFNKDINNPKILKIFRELK